MRFLTLITVFITHFSTNYAHSQDDFLLDNNFNDGMQGWVASESPGVENIFFRGNSFSSVHGSIPMHPSGASNYLLVMWLDMMLTANGQIIPMFNPGVLGDTSIELPESLAVNTIDKVSVEAQFDFFTGTEVDGKLVEFYYSVNNLDWILIDVLHSDGEWVVNQSYHLPEFDNQASLRFKFSWYNAIDHDGLVTDRRSFALDNFKVLVRHPSIEIVNVIGEFENCHGLPNTFQLEIDPTVEYGTEPDFTVQLSDETGDWSNPITIASQAFLNPSETYFLTCEVPSTMPAGSSYQLRIHSDAAQWTRYFDHVYVVHQTPEIELTNPNLLICKNGLESISNGISPNGGSFFINGNELAEIEIDLLPNGEYPCTYIYSSTAGCDASSNFTLTIDDATNLVVGNVPHFCADDAAIQLDFIQPSAGIYSGNGIQNNLIDPSVLGIGSHAITYNYINDYGCTSVETAIIEISNCASIKDMQPESVLLFPNPTENYFSINLTDLTDVHVYDMGGRLLRSFTALQRYDVGDLNGGLYWIEIIGKSDTSIVLLRKY